MKINTKFDIGEEVFFVEKNWARSGYSKIQTGKVEDIRLTVYEFINTDIKEFYRIKSNNGLSLEVKPKWIFRNKKDAEKFLCKKLLSEHEKIR